MKSLGMFLEGIWWDVEGGTYRWKHTSNGAFSVQSAYEVIKSNMVNSGCVGEQSDKGKMQKFWRKIWSCRVLNKLKVLCWRLYHNSLPDAKNLLKRGIIIDDHCRLCDFRVETGLHVIRDCWWAQAVVQEFGLHMPFALQMVNNAADWLWNMAMLLTEEDFRSLVIVIWLCWKNRNRVWHGEESWSVKKADIVGKFFLRSPSFWFAPNPLVNVDLSGRWMAPVEGIIKINTDGSWCSNTRLAGVGVVARDHRGMELASRQGVKKGTFEIDSLEVYKAISIGIGVED
ncbi:hypothetical protein QQ045_000987 [Rhodiola kirilowii]